MRWAATGGPNQVVTASASLYARSPTRVTYIRRAELTVVGAGPPRSLRGPHPFAYLASTDVIRTGSCVEAAKLTGSPNVQELSAGYKQHGEGPQRTQ